MESEVVGQSCYEEEMRKVGRAYGLKRGGVWIKNMKDD